MLDTSRACRRNLSAPWKSTVVRNTLINQSVLANCFWGCHLYVQCRRKSSSNSSSSGWSAKRPSRHSSATCSYPVPVSIGPTCHLCKTTFYFIFICSIFRIFVLFLFRWWHLNVVFLCRVLHRKTISLSLAFFFIFFSNDIRY